MYIKNMKNIIFIYNVIIYKRDLQHSFYFIMHSQLLYIFTRRVHDLRIIDLIEVQNIDFIIILYCYLYIYSYNKLFLYYFSFFIIIVFICDKFDDYIFIFFYTFLFIIFYKFFVYIVNKFKILYIYIQQRNVIL